MVPKISESSPEQVMQRVRLELYRDNLAGALDILARERLSSGNPAYDAEMARIRSWLTPLARRDTYAATYERYYRRVKHPFWLKDLERRLRVFTGRKTRRLVERHASHPEFMRLEREVRGMNARRASSAPRSSTWYGPSACSSTSGIWTPRSRRSSTCSVPAAGYASPCP